MTNSKPLSRSHMHDVQRTAEYAESRTDYTDLETDRSVSANVGDLMAVALAAAGQSVLRLGGSYAVETDYLAACGGTFPADVTMDELIAFNHETLRPVMDESLEMRRYAAIAEFFTRKHHAA